MLVENEICPNEEIISWHGNKDCSCCILVFTLYRHVMVHHSLPKGNVQMYFFFTLKSPYLHRTAPGYVQKPWSCSMWLHSSREHAHSGKQHNNVKVPLAWKGQSAETPLSDSWCLFLCEQGKRCRRYSGRWENPFKLLVSAIGYLIHLFGEMEQLQRVGPHK